MRRLRKVMAAAALAACLSTVISIAGAQGAVGPNTLRIGVVIPTFTPGRTVATSLYDFVGQAAQQGALQAYGDYSSAPDDDGIPVRVYMASAPSAEAAVRAANRLLTVDHVHALVGGIAPGEAEALARIAQNAGIPFLNIGSPSPALRAECRPTTFHVEASAGMFLDALAQWYSGPQEAKKRWFIVYYNTAAGRALRARAEASVTRVAGGTVVGTATVPPGAADYRSALDHVRSIKADVIVSLLGAVDQITFESQIQSLGPHVAVAAYPDPVGQTRDYLGALNWRASTAGSGDRVALWDTTLAAPAAAKKLNDRYIGQWGQPMDPTAWAGYEAVNILHQAALKAGSIDPAKMMSVMEDPSVSFDVAKGAGTSFRPWNHQLRQPLYIIRPDANAPWGPTASKQVAFASVAGTVPSAAAGGPKALDSLGNGPTASKCHL